MFLGVWSCAMMAVDEDPLGFCQWEETLCFAWLSWIWLQRTIVSTLRF